MADYHLPLIHDLYVLANLPAWMVDSSIAAKIDEILRYVLDPRFQAFSPGYGYAWIKDRRTCYSWGWSPHLAGYTDLGWQEPPRPVCWSSRWSSWPNSPSLASHAGSSPGCASSNSIARGKHLLLPQPFPARPARGLLCQRRLHGTIREPPDAQGLRDRVDIPHVAHPGGVGLLRPHYALGPIFRTPRSFGRPVLPETGWRAPGKSSLDSAPRSGSNSPSKPRRFLRWP